MARMSSRLLVLLAIGIIGIPTFLFINHSDEASRLHSYFKNSEDGAHPATDQADLSYGVIMDAGSTGTRLFLYCWTSKSDDDLIDIRPAVDELGNHVVKKVYPGLSSFADKPNEAAEYIKPLLDYASEHLPIAKRPYTPIFLLATAGMRLVPELKQKAILNDLHTKLPLMTEMQVMKEHIRVIEGKWEGIYSWIAVNYILGKFNLPPAPPNVSSSTDLQEVSRTNTALQEVSRKKTVGMIDMGGASCQIAFELSQNDSFRTENVENVNLGCRDDSNRFKYKLFVTTFLGYGVNEGLRKYEQYLSDTVQEMNYTYIRDECMPVNLQKTINRNDGSKFVRKGTGDWPKCVAKLGELVNSKQEKAVTCEPSCFFGNVAAPKVTLSEMELYGFSEYWFSVEDVLALGGNYNHTILEEKSKSFCAQRWSSIQSAARRALYPKANEERLRTQCFKSAWITSILHSGFRIDEEKNKFQSAFTIQGQEVQWALGAMIYHMRYFPLRDSSKNLVVSKHPTNDVSSSFQPVLALVIVGCVIAAAYVYATVKGGRLKLRRDPSIWSYMMLNSDDTFVKSSFRAANFA